MKRRILSMALALMMVLSLLPVTTLAETVTPDPDWYRMTTTANCGTEDFGGTKPAAFQLREQVYPVPEMSLDLLLESEVCDTQLFLVPTYKDDTHWVTICYTGVPQMQDEYWEVHYRNGETTGSFYFTDTLPAINEGDLVHLSVAFDSIGLLLTVDNKTTGQNNNARIDYGSDDSLPILELLTTEGKMGLGAAQLPNRLPTDYYVTAMKMGTYSFKYSDYLHLASYGSEEAIWFDANIPADGSEFNEALLPFVEKLPGAANHILTPPELRSVKEIQLNNQTPKATELWSLEYFTELEVLSANNNALTELDVTLNPKLKSLSVRKNALTELDVSHNPVLETLDVSSNKLTTLDVSHNTKLVSLSANTNALTTLNLSENTALRVAIISENKLTALDVSGNTSLTNLNAFKNQISQLNLGEINALTFLHMDDNQLQSVDLSHLSQLEIVRVEKNQLKALDVSHNPKLTTVACRSNQISVLDVSGNPELTNLYCSSNQIPSLDLGQNPNIFRLLCADNRLSHLDLSGTKFTSGAQEGSNPSLDCTGNVRFAQEGMPLAALTGFDVQKVSNPQGGSFDGGKVHFAADKITYTYDMGPCSQTFALAKGTPDVVAVTKDFFPDDNFRGFVAQLPGAEDGWLTPAECSAITEVVVPKGKDMPKDLLIRDLTGIQHFPNLQTLECRFHPVETVDVSHNPALETLFLDDAQFTHLDVSHNPALEWLICDYCHGLTELDVSHNPALVRLYCDETKITDLDLSHNPNLKILLAGCGALEALHLEGAAALETVNVRGSHVASVTADDSKALTDLYTDECVRIVPQDAPLSVLPGFDVSRVSNVQGGSFDGGKIHFTANQITYDYLCRAVPEMKSSFTLVKQLEPIDSVSATLDYPLPVAGTPIPMEVYSGRTPENAHYIVDGLWLLYDDQGLMGPAEGTVFAAGHDYAFFFSFEAEPGYCFPDEVTFTVNGAPTDDWVVHPGSDAYAMAIYKVYTCPQSQLEAPAVKIYNSASSGRPTLTWNAIEGAKEYEIWRRVGSSGSWYRQYTTTKTSYTNTTAEPGNTYYYQVRAMDKNDQKGKLSSVKYITCDCARPGVEATLKNGLPYLTWQSIKGAKGYEIWRSTNGGDYQKMYTTTRITYTNTSAKPGNTYTYKIRALCAKSSYGDGAFSYPDKVEVPMQQLSAPNVKLSIKSDSGKPYLSWNAIGGAKEYQIWRRVGKDGSWKLQWTTTKTYYTNTSAEPGQTYYYQVRAMDKDGQKGKLSPVRYLTCDCARPDVTAATRNGQPYLTWKAIDGAKSYEIWRSTNGGEFYRQYTTTRTTYTNTSAKKGNTYTYKVKALCGRSSYGDSAFSYVDMVDMK